MCIYDLRRAILVLNRLRPHQNGPYQLLSILKVSILKAPDDSVHTVQNTIIDLQILNAFTNSIRVDIDSRFALPKDFRNSSMSLEFIIIEHEWNVLPPWLLTVNLSTIIIVLIRLLAFCYA